MIFISKKVNVKKLLILLNLHPSIFFLFIKPCKNFILLRFFFFLAVPHSMQGLSYPTKY